MLAPEISEGYTSLREQKQDLRITSSQCTSYVRSFFLYIYLNMYQAFHRLGLFISIQR